MRWYIFMDDKEQIQIGHTKVNVEVGCQSFDVEIQWRQFVNFYCTDKSQPGTKTLNTLSPMSLV